MGLFKSKEEKELDWIIQRLEMNMSNNYKDNAQDNLKELEETMLIMIGNKQLKEKSKKHYEGIIAGYKERMQGYSHKDQKPYWT